MLRKISLPLQNTLNDLPRNAGLLALVCLLVSVVVAGLIVTQEWVFLAVLLTPFLLIPLVKLLLHQPFIVLLLWLLFYPIFFRDPGIVGRYTDKLLHYTLIPGTILLLLVAMFLGWKQKRTVKIGPPDVAIWLFLFLSLTNILVLTPGPERTFIKFYFQLGIPFAVYWFLRLTKPEMVEFRYLAWIAVPVLLIQATAGMLSWFAPQVIPEWWLNRAGARTTGTVGNPAVFTLILIFCALILFRYAVQVQSRRGRVMLLTLVGLAFFCVFFSFSRGSWLGGILVWTGIVFLYPRLTGRLTVMVLLVCLPLSFTVLRQQIVWAQERLTTEETVEGRVLGGNATWGLIKARPWFGWGYDTHELYDEQFRTRVMNLAVNKEHSSHQTYLLITAEMGVVGLFIYLFPVVYWLVQTMRYWRRLPQSGFGDRRLVGMLWLVMLHYFVVSNFTEMIHSNYVGTTIWWLALGFIANLVQPVLPAAANPSSLSLSPPK